MIFHAVKTIPNQRSDLLRFQSHSSNFPHVGLCSGSLYCSVLPISNYHLFTASPKIQLLIIAPPLKTHSTKFRSLDISSKSSWRSASLILLARLGIKVLASSEVSQHKEPEGLTGKNELVSKAECRGFDRGTK